MIDHCKKCGRPLMDDDKRCATVASADDELEYVCEDCCVEAELDDFWNTKAMEEE